MRRQEVERYRQRSLSRTCLLSAVALCGAGIAPTWGQTRESAESAAANGMIEEIVVTAERREANLQDVPMAVTALTGQQLTESHSNTLQDIQHNVPGLVVSSNTAVGQPYIRGVGNEILAGLNDSAVAVHLDGAYVPRGANLLMDLFDVQRVEVLRGPQGTLYGRNATGGAINIVSVPPGFERGGHISLSAGNYDNGRLTGALNVPMSSRLGLRVSGLLESRDGYQHNLFGGERGQEKDAAAVRTALRYAGDAWDVVLSLDYARDKGNGSAVRELSGDPALAPTYLVGGTSATGFFDVNVDVPSRQRVESHGGALTISRDVGDLALKSLTAFRHSAFSLTLDQDGLDTTGVATDFGGQESDAWSQEFQLSGSGPRGEWIAGLFYFHEEASDRNELAFGEPFNSAAGLFSLDLVGEGETDAWAAFAEGTWYLTERLGVTAGGRWGYEEKEGAGQLSQNGSVVATVPGRVSSDTFTPKLGLRYDLSEQARVYLSATEGFKSGGINTVSTVVETYGPEELWSYEVGLKADWLDRRLRTNLAAFWYEYDDLQVQINTLGGLTAVDNAASARIRGVELEATAVPVGPLKLTGSLAYLHSEYRHYETVDPATGEPLDLAGNRLPRTPDWAGSVGIEYHLPLAGEDSLSFAAHYRRSEGYFFTPFEKTAKAQPHFSQVSASVTYRSRQGWWLNLWGRNLTDAHRYDFVGGADGLVGIVGISSPPRTYGMTAGYEF